MNNKLTLEKLTAFAKTRGFVYPSSEIYGGLGGIYDYGHYGYLLKENIKNAWTRSMLQDRDDVTMLDSAIFMHPKTWVASGHVDSFDDPMVDCKDCKSRFRADHLLEEFGVEIDDKAPIEELNAKLDELRAADELKCPVCGKKNLTQAKKFSLMVKSNLGSPTDALTEENIVYLRPETCGGIYLNYKNVIESLHPKLPFGIAQVGKAFRNEIVARQFIYRTREFEQMEMQYFLHPDQMKEKYEEWKAFRWAWYLEYGIPADKLKWYEHEKLAHYASEAYDVKYNYSSLGNFAEVEGIHARGNWDLSQHGKFSGEKMEYFDQERNEKYIPHIMETSVGLGRLFMMFIDNAYTEEEVPTTNGENETRIVLKLDKRLAPIKVAFLPLMKKSGLAEKAKEIYDSIKKDFVSEYDAAGSIGKRYRRQDEIGTPYCVTIDFDTLEKGTVTVRDRDTMKQEIVKVEELIGYLKNNL
jgi:glycyl-tRNA synthetase